MHNGRKYWFLILSSSLLVLSSSLRAQDTISFATVDAKTYSLYTTENWDELIRFGNLALAKGIDYYYLRVRMGTAYYKRKNYKAAENQFNRALKFNSTDEVMEYLYYCYLFEGQYERARWLTKSFSADAITATGSAQLKSFSFATLEGGWRTSDSTTQFPTAYYGQVSLGNYVHNRFSLFHALTYLNQTDFRGTTNQYQYYLGANIPLKNDWTLSSGLQPIYRTTVPIENTVIYKTITKRIVRPFRSDTIKDSTVIRDTGENGPAVSKFNLVYAIGLSKSVSNFDISLGLAIGAFDSTKQFQHSLTITYFPFGNTFLSIGCAGFLHTEDYYKSLHPAILPALSVQPFKFLSLTLSYLANNGGSLIENNGYIVNSNPDPMVSRFSVLANITITKNISLYGEYEQEDNIEYHEHWPFYYNQFITGIKYIPQ